MVKKISAVLLVLAMLLTFCACGADNNIAGKWKTTIDLSEMMNAYMSETIGAETPADAKIAITLVMTLRDDGTFTIDADRDTLSADLSAYMSEISDVLLELVYAEAEAMGMTREDFDAQVQLAYNMTTEEYVASAYGGMDLSSSFDVMEAAEGVYKVDGDKLLFADTKDELSESDYVKFTLKDGKLTFVSVEGDGIPSEAMEMVNDSTLPWVFTK
ncbi:MAG: hypothetical protein LBM28_05955 [Oscillospiraceae bacterium]|nr:hypothetical protein [Oscillospiraceae bacterium]